MPALESQLIINADDRTAAAFASVQGRIEGLMSSMAALDRGGGATAIGGRATTNAGAALASSGPALKEGDDAIKENTKALDEHAQALRDTGGGTGDFLAKVATFIGLQKVMDVMSAGVGQAFDREHEKVRMKIAGMTPEEIADSEKLAAGIANTYPSIPESEAMGLARNARSLFNSYEDAAKLLPEIASTYVITQASNKKMSPEEVTADLEQLMKATEIKGVTQNPAEFHKMMEGIDKGLAVFGDTLKPFDYYSMVKYARAAGIGLSTEFMVGVAPSIAQMMRGSSAGRAFSDFDKAVVGGHLEHAGLKELVSLGLLKDEDVDKTKTGEIKGIKPGHRIAGADLAAVDQYEWIKQYAMPAMAAKGITGQQDVREHLDRIFENQYAAYLALAYATQGQRIEKDLGKERAGHGRDAAKILTEQDPLIGREGMWNSIEGAIARTVPTDFLEKVFRFASGAANTTSAASVSGERLEPHSPIQFGGLHPENAVNPEFGRDFAHVGNWIYDRAAGWGKQPTMPARPVTPTPGLQQVNVSGQANVEHTVHVDVHVDLDPALRAKIDAAASVATEFTVPLIGGGTGVMDSDAGPHRTGGLGGLGIMR